MHSHLATAITARFSLVLTSFTLQRSSVIEIPLAPITAERTPSFPHRAAQNSLDLSPRAPAVFPTTSTRVRAIILITAQVHSGRVVGQLPAISRVASREEGGGFGNIQRGERGRLALPHRQPSPPPPPPLLPPHPRVPHFNGQIFRGKPSQQAGRRMSHPTFLGLLPSLSQRQVPSQRALAPHPS